METCIQKEEKIKQGDGEFCFDSLGLILCYLGNNQKQKCNGN